MQPVIGIALGRELDEWTVGCAYVQAIEEAGGIAVCLPPVAWDELTGTRFHFLDGVLLPGGSDIDPLHYGEEPLPENGALEPERDRFELPLARWALERHVPVFGICRGMQVLNVAAGGTLYQDLPSQGIARVQHRQKAPRDYPTHWIEIAIGSLLARITGETCIRVNTFHHQGVRQPAPGFQVSAMARDGVIEAIEMPHHPFALGVQWHPEAMIQSDPVQRALFTHFVEAARMERKSKAR